MIRAGLALLVSAFLWLSAFGYYLQGQDSGGVELTVPLTVVVGRSVSDSGDNQVMPAEDGRAILAGRVKPFTAADYPFLRLELSGQEGVEDILFFYRQAEEPDLVQSLLLPLHPGELTWYLGDEDGWKGAISEVGLIVYGDESTRLAVESLSLLPSSSRISMQAELSRWLAVWRWDQRTINFLRWDGERIAPVPAVAAWLLLALLLLSVMKVKGPKRWQLAASLVFVGWLLLDGRWFWEQYRQWSDLDNQIVAYPEGSVLAVDTELYQELERVKRDVLPDEPVRIQIVRDGPANNYWRMKAQYYLLPHSVYNYGGPPAWARLQAGDWVMVMGKVAGLTYNKSSYLRLGRHQLPARLKSQNELFSLYRIESKARVHNDTK
jgi:hypothetical protein